MTSEQLEQFYLTIDQLKAKTLSGDIVWRVLNPTTFSYETQTAKLLIQQTIQMNVPVYLFEVKDSVGRPQLEMGGNSSTEINRKLRDLFLSIRNYKDAKGLDFLKSVVS